MYIPKPFQCNEPAQCWELMRDYPFALLVSPDDQTVVATHLPLLADEANGRVLGHFAAANAQSKLSAGASVLAVFSGPHCYISPRWYREPGFVPTWNYAAVHVRGTYAPIVSESEKLEVIRKQVAQFESDVDGWSLDELDEGKVSNLLTMIVPFSIRVDSLAGQFKLSQNHSLSRKSNVCNELEKQPSEYARSIAHLMRESMKQT